MFYNFFSLYRAVMIALVNNSIRVMEKPVVLTMLVSLENTTVEAKIGV